MKNIKTHRITRMKMIFCVMFTALSLLFSTNISASEQIRIDTVQMAPLGFFAKDGKSTGFFYDMSNLIAREAGFSYQNRIVPFARIVYELENGDADFGILYRSEKNDKVTLPVSPVFSFKNIVVGLKGTTFDSLQSLHGKKVARVRGAIYDENFNKDDAIIKADTVDYRDGIRTVIHKMADATILTEIGFLFSIKQLGYPKADFGEPFVLNTKEVWVQFSKTAAKDGKNDKRIAALKTAIETLKKTDAFQNLFRKYTN